MLRNNINANNIVIYIFAFLMLIFTILPFYWMTVTSFQPEEEFFSLRIRLFPESPTLENYIQLLRETQFIRWLLNSIIVSLGCMLIGVFFCSLAGFAFAKYKFKGRELLFWIALSTIAIPEIVPIIPIFAWFSQLGIVDTYWALILPRSIQVFGIFLMRSYMESIPNDLLDAARIDGCKEITIFFRVVIPIVKPALGALGIFLWVSTWSTYLWPLIMLRSREMHTLPLGLATFYANPWTLRYGVLMSGAFLSTLPILIVFIVMHKQFVSGLTGGALKE